MNIFLSWSEDKSRKVAELLNDWLPLVIQSLKPWVSVHDIAPGSIWNAQLQSTLTSTSFGIFCVTQANKSNPWLLYEAGAVSKGDPKNRICTFLVDLDTNDLLRSPLTHFNATLNTDKSILKLLKEINKSQGETALPESRLIASFEKYWPDFDEKMKVILENAPIAKEETPTKEESLLKEILETVRRVENNTDFSYSSNYQRQNVFKHSPATIYGSPSRIAWAGGNAHMIETGEDGLIKFNTPVYISEDGESDHLAFINSITKKRVPELATRVTVDKPPLSKAPTKKSAVKKMPNKKKK